MEKEQPTSETTQAAVEKKMRKSYRELKAVLNFSFFCFKTKGQNNISRIILLKKNIIKQKGYKKRSAYFRIRQPVLYSLFKIQNSLLLIKP